MICASCSSWPTLRDCSKVILRSVLISALLSPLVEVTTDLKVLASNWNRTPAGRASSLHTGRHESTMGGLRQMTRDQPTHCIQAEEQAQCRTGVVTNV